MEMKMTDEQINWKGRTMTRSEHMAWCKQRALGELQHSGPGDAVASMLSDLRKHPETEASGAGAIAMLGMMEINNGPAAVKRWIEGFN